MRKTGTGGQTWPLTSPLSAPTFVAGGNLRFDMNDVPARCPTGPLAYYVPALILSFFGTLVNAGESPDAVTTMDLPGLIIQSVEVRDVWHGTPVSSTYWLGEHLRIHEFIGSGYEYVQRMPNWITPATSPGADASFQVRVPLSGGEGQLIRETSQLALLYQPGSVFITMKPASVLNGVSANTTWSDRFKPISSSTRGRSSSSAPRSSTCCTARCPRRMTRTSRSRGSAARAS